MYAASFGTWRSVKESNLRIVADGYRLATGPITTLATLRMNARFCPFGGLVRTEPKATHPVEQHVGLEPTLVAWKARVLPVTPVLRMPPSFRGVNSVAFGDWIAVVWL